MIYVKYPILGEENFLSNNKKCIFPSNFVCKSCPISTKLKKCMDYINVTD